MKKNLKKVVLVLALLLPGVIKAQEFNVTAKADFVSDYIWRGAYQNSGFSVQPTLGLSYDNLSLSAWGSQSLTKTDGAQEFDINLSYTIGGLGITVTDYWWNGITMPYGDYKHDHHFEGTLAYNFGENFPLTLSWSTMFAGGDDNKDGDRAYSTYINASYNIACPAEITLTPSVGFTPWKGMYDADGAAFTDIALKASKNINITDHFSLPLFVFIELKEKGFEPLLSLSKFLEFVNSIVPGRLKTFLISDFSPSATGAINLPSTFFCTLFVPIAAIVLRY